MLLVPGYQLHLDVSISHQKSRMLFYITFGNVNQFFNYKLQLTQLLRNFLKCLVYVSTLSQPQNKDIIRAKPSITSIFIVGHLVANTGYHWMRFKAALWLAGIIFVRMMISVIFSETFGTQLLMTSQKGMTSQLEFSESRSRSASTRAVYNRFTISWCALIRHRFTNHLKF